MKPRPRPAAPQPDNTKVFIGVGIGAVLLIVVAVAASSGEKKAKPAVKPRVAEPVAPAYTPPVRIETGSIIFACANSPGHPDEEVRIGGCPCGAQAKFYGDSAAQGYRCLKCKQVFDNAQIKCSKCGKVAVKTHLKPAFD